MFRADATYYDGEKAGTETVCLVSEGGWLRIERPDGKLLTHWELSDIRLMRDGAGHAVIHRVDDVHDARLVLADQATADRLAQIAPNLRKRPPAGGALKKAGAWLGAAVAAIGLMIFVIIPGLANQLALFIPPEREAAIGRAAMSQIERFLNGGDAPSWICSSPEGDIALAKMTDRLMGERELPYDLQVAVVRHPLVNAFAAPGGYVVLMEGLVDRAETPEEVAGVLAHEIGHVAARDPIRLTLRAAGSAGILTLILGDATGAAAITIAAEQLLSASYTRQAETEADLYALDMLAEANVSAEGFASFFDRLREEYGDMDGALEYFMSHPALASRAEVARSRVDAEADTTPILTDAEWGALREICN